MTELYGWHFADNTLYCSLSRKTGGLKGQSHDRREKCCYQFMPDTSVGLSHINSGWTLENQVRRWVALSHMQHTTGDEAASDAFTHIWDAAYTLAEGWRLGRACRRLDVTQSLPQGAGSVNSIGAGIISVHVWKRYRSTSIVFPRIR